MVNLVAANKNRPNLLEVESLHSDQDRKLSQEQVKVLALIITALVLNLLILALALLLMGLAIPLGSILASSRSLQR